MDYKKGIIFSVIRLDDGMYLIETSTISADETDIDRMIKRRTEVASDLSGVMLKLRKAIEETGWSEGMVN
jgi:cytidylate kinase